jgi:hypothetical protein
VATIRLPLLARRTHKWLAVFVAAQAVIWTLSGLYMTAVHIDIIHGDHFVRMAEPRPIAPGEIVDPIGAARSVPGAETLKLNWLQDRPTYIVSAGKTQALIDARTGARLPPPTKEEIRQLADHWFTGRERLARVALVHDLPGEVRGRTPPLWRAEFDGWNKPTLYFSPATGELVTRRHELWRVFDFVWMLHIMDYDERENVNNWLLRGFTWAAVVMALSGAWLLIYSFPRRKRRKARP